MMKKYATTEALSQATVKKSSLFSDAKTLRRKNTSISQGFQKALGTQSPILTQPKKSSSTNWAAPDPIYYIKQAEISSIPAASFRASM